MKDIKGRSWTIACHLIPFGKRGHDEDFLRDNLISVDSDGLVASACLR